MLDSDICHEFGPHKLAVDLSGGAESLLHTRAVQTALPGVEEWGRCECPTRCLHVHRESLCWGLQWLHCWR